MGTCVAARAAMTPFWYAVIAVAFFVVPSFAYYAYEAKHPPQR